MKKLFKLNLYVFFIFAFLMSSCKSQSPIKPVTNFSAIAEIQADNIKLIGEFSNTYQGLMTFSVTEPETLKGLNYVFKNNELEISFEEIKLNTTNEYLLDENNIKLLFDCFYNIGKEEYTCIDSDEFQACYETDVNGRTCLVYINQQNGMIEKIETENMNIIFGSQKSFET